MIARSSVVFALALSLAWPAAADEGMWPFNMVPKAELEEQYGFTPTEEWLNEAMTASVRFNNGGSGSFVSPEGLVMTNHHVGAGCIQKLSQGEDDYMKNGFVAASRDEEQKCPALELNRLVAIDDVTMKVDDAAAGIEDEAEAAKAQKAKMAELEKACAEESGRRCDVVTLYSGGAYHLYQYDKYTDIRLAFAPEAEVAFFGGDPENFTFPRTVLDVALFRVYDDEGQPVDSSGFYLPFSQEGAQRGQLVFVSGNPGSTGRFSTTAELEHLRDRYYPFLIQQLKDKRDRLLAYMETSPEAERAARGDLASVENSIKALTGYLEGLQDPALMQMAEDRQAKVKAKLEPLPDDEEQRLLVAWDKLAEAYAKYGEIYKGYLVTERYFAPSGELVDVAQTLLRLGAEEQKPSGERLREYRESNIESVELQLYSDEPIDDGLEIMKVEAGLEAMVDVFGKDHPVVRAALAGKEPRARAEELVKSTALRDVETRKKLREGGQAAVDAAKDPMVEFVRSYDQLAREYRQRYEDEVEAVEKAYAGRIAEAWAKAYGTDVYPDATFTPRLSWGVVQGYEEDGERRSWRTQIGDLYRKHKRHDGEEPYELPKSWTEAVGRVDFSVPLNFVSTNDIIGGNSGSPVFNGKGEVVGLIFDGNLQMLPNRFVYRDEQARAISVHTQAIVHALEKVYEAEGLVRELGFVGSPVRGPAKQAANR